MSFLALRTVYFPLVVGAGVLPDFAALVAAGLGPVELGLAGASVVGAVALTLLQWHWSWLLLRRT